MSSSQIARVVLGALWLIATLLLTSAHTRVLAKPQPSRRRYIVAWLVCVVVLGALLSAMDNVTGRGDRARVISDFAIAAVMTAAALGAAAWWTHRPAWADKRRAARFLTRALIHGFVVLVLGYAFI